MVSTINNEKLSIKTKLGFGIGDFYGGGVFTLIAIYYLFFLTDVLLINPVLAGTIFLVCKIWNAIIDPVMGVISDRTRSRYGRRRPYILAGVFFVFITFFLIWYPVAFKSEILRFAYYLVAFLFYSTVYTMVMIPYNALSSELTLDYNERTSLTTYRMIFSTISSLICAVAPIEVTKFFADIKEGYMVMAIIFGIFFALPFIATFLFTKERPEFQGNTIEPINLLKSFASSFRTPTFVNVVLMYLFAFIAMDAVMTIIMYFMKYYLNRGNETDYVMGVLLVVQLISFPVFSLISKKTSKKTSYTIAAMFWMAVMFFSFFITPTAHPYLIYILGGLVGIGTGGVVIMVYSIFPDVPDIDELYTGQRREGLFSGLLTFMRKLSSAFMIFFISNAIAIAGYKPPIENTGKLVNLSAQGAIRMVDQVQNANFILVLRFIFALVPIICLIFCIYNAYRYALTPSLHAKIKEFLDRRRKVKDPTPELIAEQQALMGLLTRK